MTVQDCHKPTFSRNLTPIVATFLAIAILCVRAPAQAAVAGLTFDVASIHINNTETDGHHHILNDPAESHFRTVNLALRDLIQLPTACPTGRFWAVRLGSTPSCSTTTRSPTLWLMRGYVRCQPSKRGTRSN